MRYFLYSIAIFFGLLILPIAHAETTQEPAPTTSDVQIQHKNKSIQRYLRIIADIPFSPSVQAQLPDYEKILTEITAHNQKPSDDELEKLNLLYDALKQNDVAHALPRLTRYYLDIYRKEQKIYPFDVATLLNKDGAKPDAPASKQQKLKTYFKLLDEAALMPEVAKQLPDYKKIFTNIYLHEQKPNNNELIKLDLFYDDLQAIRTLDAMPRKLRYSIGNYRKHKVTLPRNWQTMEDKHWINFLQNGVTSEQIQAMLEQGLDPNKMITIMWDEWDVTQYSLLYGVIHFTHSVDIVKILLNAGANPNLTDAKKTTLPLDRAIELERFDVALLLIKHGAINIGNNYQILLDGITQSGPNELERFDAFLSLIKNGAISNQNTYQDLFDALLQEIVHHHYGLDYNINFPKAILTLEYLIEQGANPNTTISYENGDTDHTKTPLSYALLACINDDEANHTDGRNFYLDIMKLLVNEKTDWNAKDSISSYYGGGETSTIADMLAWVGKEEDKPKCIEALDYVKNHLKENNIIIEE